jgi:hypothetical protein
VHEAGGVGTDHPGYGSCKRHAGSTPNGRAAARVEMARDSLERLGVTATATPVNPVELLGDLIDQSAAIVAYLREQVAALPAVLTAEGQRGQLPQEPVRPGLRQEGWNRGRPLLAELVG